MAIEANCIFYECCGHALAVILDQEMEIKDFVKPFFTVAFFKYIYASSILHPHNIDFAASLEFSLDVFNALSDESDVELTLSLNTKRPIGRSKKCCIHTNSEVSQFIHIQKCGRCSESGYVGK
jgi:hypothetical protein